MDITDFYDTFFEEAEELLGDMERHLLNLDLDAPDIEQLNAIFRAAHSIKGGAGTFGFDVLQHTTHLFENILDYARRGELVLRRDIIDIFLETKDMLHDQLDAYRNGAQPDADAYARICRVLQQMALDEIGTEVDGGPLATDPQVNARGEGTAAKPADQVKDATKYLDVALIKVNDKDRELLVEELGQLGKVLAERSEGEHYLVTVETSASADDIEAVMCFIIEPEQIKVTPSANASAATPVAEPALPRQEVSPEPQPSPQLSQPQAASSQPDSAPSQATQQQGTPAPVAAKRTSSESASIRVPVNKVDQIINLVGELIITQSMLDQTVSEIEGLSHGALVNGMSLLQRNARDLQEAVMSIRMVPMDYVFSRFPRLVRDLAAKLDKQVELVTEGKSTELDKSLTERIIDPLTHLVRNSLDHGVETAEKREAAGKSLVGKLTLSAQHQGGNILIEVRDDGAGLNREKLLTKARESGLSVSDGMSDDEVWQLIFAPGFSTAKEVSNVSGRGVGMDVVKRNIQGMGGHVEVLSRPGEGTTTRIVLPLTLAILDGMLIKVGKEIFIVPLGAVLESLQPNEDELYAMAGDDILLKVRDEYLPVIAVHEVLEVEDACTKLTESIAVIVQGEGRRYALLVDDLLGQQQVVVKNLETNYRKVPGISAATILGNGSVALILDIADLHRLSRTKKEAHHASRLPAGARVPVPFQEVDPS